MLGSVEESSEHPGQWHDGRLASAWALTEDGVLVTNWHVFDKLGKECYGVVNSRGEVFPVIDALGCDPAADIALIRVAGKDFTALPLAADEKVGAWVGVLSHPGNQFYTFTQGHVTRYSENGAGDKRQRWMSLSADFAYGSSGAPVLNRFGAVVGMATVTSNIDYPVERVVRRRAARRRPGQSVAEAAGETASQGSGKGRLHDRGEVVKEVCRSAVGRRGRALGGADGCQDGRAGADDSRVLHGRGCGRAGQGEVAGGWPR